MSLLKYFAQIKILLSYIKTKIIKCQLVEIVFHFFTPNIHMCKILFPLLLVKLDVMPATFGNHDVTLTSTYCIKSTGYLTYI